jgi:hypothetical protein
MIKYHDVLLDPRGNCVTGVTIKVYAAGTNTLSTIYSDDGVTLIDQTNDPIQTDSSGNFEFYVTAGTYKITATKTGYGTITQDDVTIPSASGGVGPTWVDEGEGTYSTGDDLIVPDITANSVTMDGGNINEQAVDLIAGTEVDVRVGSYFYRTANAPWTLTIIGAPSVGRVSSFTLEVTGDISELTQPANVIFPDNVTPEQTVGTDVFVLTYWTRDSGTIWFCSLVGSYVLPT